LLAGRWSEDGRQTVERKPLTFTIVPPATTAASDSMDQIGHNDDTKRSDLISDQSESSLGANYPIFSLHLQIAPCVR
jgi:hypothetical protein